MSKVASILNYGGVLFAGETEENLSHYHTGMMRIIRAINQEYTFMEPCEVTCKKAELLMPKQMLINATAKFAHRVVTLHEPEPIYKTIHVPTHPRSCQELFSTLKAKTNRRKRCLIIRLPKVYNSIPSCLKLLNPYSFKKKLRTFEIAETPIT